MLKYVCCWQNLHVSLRLLSISFELDVHQYQVINESLRITSTAPTMLRINDQELRVDGYTIPPGWIIMGYPSVHFNPEKYDDPLAFNPWRWKVIFIFFFIFCLFTLSLVIKVIHRISKHKFSGQRLRRDPHEDLHALWCWC